MTNTFDDDYKGPFDKDEIVKIIKESCDPILPPPNFETIYKARWDPEKERKNWPTGLTIEINRDLSPIYIYLDMGTFRYTKRDMIKAAKDAVKNIPEAVDRMMEERSEITINQADLGMLIHFKTDYAKIWDKMRDHFSLPLNRTVQRISPLGISEKKPREKLKWRSIENMIEFRLGKKQIKYERISVSGYYYSDRMLELNSRIPCSLMEASKGKPLTHLIDFEAFKYLNATVDFYRQNKNTVIFLKSPTSTIEESFSLLKEISKK